MLENTITLAVDKLNTGTPTDVIFSRQEVYQNRVKYISPAHALAMRDTLDFYRTFPTKTKDFNGVAKSGFKFTVDTEVPGVDTSVTRISPQILEISFSLPVGFTTAQLVELRQRAIALLDNDVLMGRLNERLEV